MAKQVSKEQKLERLLSLFTPTEVFSLKELEKAAGKVGLRSQLIKDLVTELVNDNHISSDKIGISHYYWKFPLSSEVEIAKLEQENEKLQKEIETLENQENALKSTRNAENREELIEEFVKLTQMKEQMSISFNYDEFKDLTEKVEQLKNSINETTDDIFILQSYVTEKFGMSRDDFNKAFGVKEDMDVID